MGLQIIFCGRRIVDGGEVVSLWSPACACGRFSLWARLRLASCKYRCTCRRKYRNVRRYRLRVSVLWLKFMILICQANALHLASFMYDSHAMMLTNHIHVLIIIVCLSLGIELHSETSPYKTITIERYYPVLGIYLSRSRPLIQVPGTEIINP
jgi:hypothetical protein